MVFSLMLHPKWFQLFHLKKTDRTWTHAREIDQSRWNQFNASYPSSHDGKRKGKRKKKKNQTLSPHLRRPPEPVVQEAAASGITTAGRRRSGSPCCRRRDGGGEQEEDERPPWQSVRAHGDHLRLASELAGSLLVVSLTKLLYGGELLLLVILTRPYIGLWWWLYLNRIFLLRLFPIFPFAKSAHFFMGKAIFSPHFVTSTVISLVGPNASYSSEYFLLKNKLLRCNVCTTRMTLYDSICTLNSCCFNSSACSFCLWCSLCDVWWRHQLCFLFLGLSLYILVRAEYGGNQPPWMACPLKLKS